MARFSRNTVQKQVGENWNAKRISPPIMRRCIMPNDYYVYEHIRKDTNECFYVGKGKGKRAYQTKRNNHHDRIADKHGMEVRIVKSGLSEEEALDLEKQLIEKYILLDGYGIDMPDMNYGVKDKSK